MSDIHRLGKHSVIYAIGNIAQGAVGFLLIPIYTKFLSTAEYGYLEIINNFSAILVILGSLGFNSAILKTYFRDTKSEQERKSLLGSAVILAMLFAAVLVTIIYLLRYFATGLLLAAGYEQILALTLAYSWFIIFMNLGLALLRAQERSVIYTIASLARFMLVLGLNFYLIYYLQLGLNGIILANLVSYALIALYLLPSIIKNTSWNISSNLLGKLLQFGLPLIPASLATWTLDLADRYLIKTLRSPEEAGIYALGYKFGFLIDLALVAPFQLAWPTIYFSIAEKPEAKQIYSRVLTYFTALGSICALIISLFSTNIIKLFSQNSAYYPAASIIPYIAFAYVIYGIHFILVVGLHLANKNKYYPWLIIIPAIINVAVNVFIVPIYGMLGASLVTLGSFILVALATGIMSNYFYPINYDVKKAGFALLFAFLLSLPVILFPGISDLYKATIIIAYATILAIFGIIRIKDVKSLSRVFIR